MSVLPPHLQRIQERERIFLCGHLSDLDAGKNMALPRLGWGPACQQAAKEEGAE